MSLHAAPARLPLWPDGAPAAKGKTDDDQPWMDVYLPEKTKANGCAIVIAPGGGYGGLADDHEGIQPAMFWNSHGVTAFVLHYRLGSKGYHHPVQLGDGQRAVRLVRAKAADYGIDLKRIGMMGFSAGGHLASTVGTHFDAGKADAPDAVDRVSSRPDFLVLGYPVISFDPEITHSGSVKNLLGPEAGNPELIRLLSSELQVTPATPPAFLFHTAEDSGVPVANSLRFFEALQKHKIPSEMHIYQHGPHGVGLTPGDPVLGTWSGHANAWLRDNGWYAPEAKRAAVEGTLTVNGKPVTWGSITFQPEDPDLPVVTVRARRGQFSAKPPAGPVIGRMQMKVTFSANDTGSPAPDGFLTTTKAADGSTLVREIQEGANPLKLDLKWPE